MLWWTIQNVLIASGLAGLVWLICRSRSVSPAARHALWLIVLIKLLTPPLIVWPWAIPTWQSSPVPIELIEETVATLPESPPVEFHEELLPEEQAQSAPSPLLREPPPPVSLAVSFSFKQAFAAAWIVWLTGGIACLSIHIIRIVRVRRSLRGSTPVDADLARQIADLAKRLRMSPIAARQVSGLGSPFIWSLMRPTLYWPSELTASLSVPARQGLILHELAHVKRRDHWVGWLELIASCVWWWNPLFWYVRHQLRENAELACDACVVATLPKGRRAYAEALLFVCERISCRTAALAVGVSAGSRRSLERRLTMILRHKVDWQLSQSGFCALLVLFAAALPAWSQGSAAPGEGPIRYRVVEESRPAGPVFTARVMAARAPLPPDAQEVITQFEREQAGLRQELEAKIAARRQELQRQLKEMQDRYTRDAKLDEAVAIRDHLRSLQGRTVTAATATTTADPGQLSAFRGQTNTVLFIEVVGSTDGYIWGTDVYTDDSQLSTAAVHAGVVQPGQKGLVRVTIVAPPQSFSGSTRHGVTSHDYGVWGGAYRVEPYEGPRSVRMTVPGLPSSTITSTYGLKPRSAASSIVEVVGSTGGSVWGTDVYTDDSDLGTAAVHAGLLQNGERGSVRVTRLPGRDSYQGSSRNGVTSYDYGEWSGSLRLQRVNPVSTLRKSPEGTVASSPHTLVGTTLLPIGMPPATSFPGYETLSGLKSGSVLILDLVGSTSGSVWGSDVYTTDSTVAAAAVHAGVLRDGERGQVKITLSDGRDSYTGTTRNGFTSSSWGAYDGSFRIERVPGTP